MTGLATAPHLHFEVLVHGAQRDPRVALRNVSSDPVPLTETAEFAQVRSRMLALMDSSTQLAVSQAGATTH
jgi:murein DD-endopeptidase MepM/ murein hydrolase activator NlpD